MSKPQILSYPLRLPDEAQSDALRLLDASKQTVNRVLAQLWPALDLFGERRPGPAWKHVTELLDSPNPHGNRQWRCEAETAGRILRAQAQRKQWFETIVPILTDGFIRPKTEQRPAGKNRSAINVALTRLRKDLQGEQNQETSPETAAAQEETSFVALQNVVEQCCNFYCQHDRFPATYDELQPLPLLSVGVVTYAGDDGGEQGQAHRLALDLKAGTAHLRFRYPDEAGVWQWRPFDTVIPLPSCVMERLAHGDWLAPVLREVQPRSGEKGACFAVLDCCIAVVPETLPAWDTVERVLGADWGVHTLVTATAVDAHSGQVGRPFFLNTGGFDGRQARTRRQIDHLKKKVALYEQEQKALVEKSPHYAWLTRRIARYQEEIDRCWGKYERRNRALAHLASNVLLLLCLVHGCSLLAMESLTTLKTTGRGKGARGRWRNWRNNTQIRGEIWRLLRYKCHLHGVRFHTERPRGTSHTCPRCGHLAQTYRSPSEDIEVMNAVSWGRWLSCAHCGYNGDRDYCASINIARLGCAYLVQSQVLTSTKYPKQPKQTSTAQLYSVTDPQVKPVSYTGAGAVLLLPPPGSHARPQLSGKLCYYPGWLESAYLQSSQPKGVFLRLCG